MNQQTQQRKSSIELLKIFAIFLIILSHCVHSLFDSNTFIPYTEHIFLGGGYASRDITTIVLSLLYYAGCFGNNIFFICSCWFLCTNDPSKPQKMSEKIAFLLCNIWVISILILIILNFVPAIHLNKMMILRSVFPTIFSNNWYLTCYIILYAIHPYLNLVIAHMNQKTHLRCCLIMCVMYFMLNFARTKLLFPSKIIIWIVFYFCISYIKKYSTKFITNKRMHYLLVLLGFGGNTLLILATNFLGLKSSLFYDKVLYWNVINNPFIFATAIGLFLLANLHSYKSTRINKIAGLSLLMYVIHENILLRTYVRPYLFLQIHTHLGYSYILLYTVLLAIAIFIFSLIVSMLYSISIQKIVKKVAHWLHQKTATTWERLENKFFL